MKSRVYAYVYSIPVNPFDIFIEQSVLEKKLQATGEDRHASAIIHLIERQLPVVAPPFHKTEGSPST